MSAAAMLTAAALKSEYDAKTRKKNAIPKKDGTVKNPAQGRHKSYSMTA